MPPAGASSYRPAHNSRPGGFVRHALLREWKWVLLVAGFSAALAAVHFANDRMEARLHMQAFVASLGGSSSAEYCPDYVPLVKAALSPYYLVEDGPGPERGERAGGAALVPAEEARVEAFLEAIGGYRYAVRRGGTRLTLRPRKSQKHRKRLADFRANVALAQQAFGPLPDVDGWVVWGDLPTLGRADWPLEGVRLPPLGYSTTKGHYDVPMPYVAQEAWREEDLARLAELVLAHPWESKIARAVWRGSSTGSMVLDDATLWALPRAVLVNASLAHPTLLDARFTACKQCLGRVERLYAEAGYGYDRFFSFEEQFKFRALVDVDGNSWSSRFPQLLSINSAVFKQETAYHEFFRPLLKPNVHYIPVAESLDDLPRLLQRYLSSNRSVELREVAAEATRFYIRHLTPSKQLCYFHLLLTEMGRIHAQAQGDGGGHEKRRQPLA